ncbi:acetyl-CoA carboxylase biotin carboxyl carrier protein subunit [Candidatus Fermentibacteria bacterium]|nr:MAG: acetyl-CoA carboxylase biotin carboxyl carrier protein subunit [Candidatus Fermentibacteria bacterium]
MTEEKKLNIDETLYETEVPEGFGPKWTAPDERLVKAFIPGTIIELKVKEGDTVKEGDILLILDAMKMYNEIASPVAGKVAEIAVEPSQRVEKNQLLVRLG